MKKSSSKNDILKVAGKLKNKMNIRDSSSKRSFDHSEQDLSQSKVSFVSNRQRIRDKNVRFQKSPTQSRYATKSFSGS